MNSEQAASAYAIRTAEIRRTMDRGTRAYATAMSDASAEYEAAMVADIGTASAALLGAGMPRLS